MVREIPSNVIHPLGTTYFNAARSDSAGLISIMVSLSFCSMERIVPNPSTWPETMCPPILEVGSNARSRFTRLPVETDLIEVLRMDSSSKSKDRHGPSIATMVKQHPLIETLSPSFTSSKINFASTTRRHA